MRFDDSTFNGCDRTAPCRRTPTASHIASASPLSALGVCALADAVMDVVAAPVFVNAFQLKPPALLATRTDCEKCKPHVLSRTFSGVPSRAVGQCQRVTSPIPTFG